jgi:hypothetical protein
MGHVVRSGTSGERNVIALFFILGWDQYGFHKKCSGASELMFMHPVGSAGHVVHSQASKVRNLVHYFSFSGGTSTDSTKSVPVCSNLCLCIQWDLRVM